MYSYRMKILYLDVCALCRPFDDQNQLRIRLETDYLQSSKIELIFLPPYAPNLNLIEHYWHFFKKGILYSKHYGTFALFKQACDDFFATTEQHKDTLHTLLTDNFQIIGCTGVPKFGT